MSRSIRLVFVAGVLAVATVSPPANAAPPDLRFPVFTIEGPSSPARPGEPVYICGCTMVRVGWFVDVEGADGATGGYLSVSHGPESGPIDGPLSLTGPRVFGMAYKLMDVRMCQASTMVLAAWNAQGELNSMVQHVLIGGTAEESNCGPPITSFDVSDKNVCGCKTVRASWTTVAGTRVEMKLVDLATGHERMLPGGYAGSGERNVEICQSTKLVLYAVGAGGEKSWKTRSVQRVPTGAKFPVPLGLSPVPDRSCQWAGSSAEPVGWQHYTPDMKIVEVHNGGRDLYVSREGRRVGLRRDESTPVFNGLRGAGSWSAEASCYDAREQPNVTAYIGCPSP